MLEASINHALEEKCLKSPEATSKIMATRFFSFVRKKKKLDEFESIYA
jgi:hypothetical protein